MNVLKGTISQIGNIDFFHRDNLWAFERMKSKGTSIPRVVFDPQQAPIELTLSRNADPEEFPWVDRVHSLLLSSDKVFLRPEQDSLRFVQAVHEIGKHRQLITLGTQRDVSEFAKQYWENVRYFYASRLDEFRFTISTLVTHRKDGPTKSEQIEIKARVNRIEQDSPPKLSFNATGSDAPPQIVEWRGTVKEERSSRFGPEKSHIHLSVALHREPLVLLHEYREEFRNHSFVFEGEKIDLQLKKIAKRHADFQID